MLNSADLQYVGLSVGIALKMIVLIISFIYRCKRHWIYVYYNLQMFSILNKNYATGHGIALLY